MNKGELIITILAIIILGISVAFTRSVEIYLVSLITVTFIVLANIITKKIIAFNLEADIEIKQWKVYRYGFKKNAHFKEPISMIWLPIILTMISRGLIWWLAILKFEVKPRRERVSKRHGLYRFTEMTEKHIGLIALCGVITNILLSIIMYTLDFEFFSKVSILYALWSLVPISDLDGSKIFFSNPTIWTIVTIITGIISILIVGSI